MSVKDAIKQVLIKQQDRRYEKLLAQRKVVYDEWVKAEEEKEAKARAYSSDAVGEIVVLVQKAGRLGEYALDAIKAYFVTHPEIELLYGDEDMLRSDGIRSNPWYKPCWSPDLYASCFYLGSVIAVRRSLLTRLQERVQSAGDNIDANRTEVATGLKVLLQKNAEEVSCTYYEHAEEIRDLIYSLLKEAGGFQKGCRAIGHVDYILFSVNKKEVWQEYEEISGVPMKPDRMESGDSVSVIIPSKDNPEVLETCVQSLHMEKRSDMELVIVDNGSNAENKSKIEKMIAKLPESVRNQISYLYHPMEFNFSNMCNRGAEHSKGRFLLFLNDDMEMCDNDWLEIMRDKAAEDYVGAVGLKLYYPESKQMQHAGIVNMTVGPMHKLQFLQDDKSYYFGRNRLNYNCVAVTGACLMVERKKFREAGGFKEALRVAYNDVELGFALVELGYQNVVINERYAYHHESLSRGNDDTREKIERLERERKTLYQMHPAFKGEDPYYPVKLNRQGVDFRVAPNYVNAKNTLQKGVCKPLPYPEDVLRLDKCLMIGVEVNEPALLQGYSVVLGDDNACYEKYLVLIPEADGDFQLKNAFSVKLEGQYRQDLEENIPDQVNVALNGFCVNVEEVHLPKGNYQIAVLAVNKVTGLKLINESGKCLKVEE